MTNWTAILQSRAMENLTRRFALGFLSAQNWYNEAIDSDLGKHVRPVVKTRSVTNARNIARKALKRRRIINSFNLPLGVSGQYDKSI